MSSLITYFNHFSLDIVKNINGLSLITGLERYDASKNSIKVHICQDKVCCVTSILPGEYEKGTRIEYSAGSDLNNCDNWPIRNNKELKAIIYHTTDDGWSGGIEIYSTFNSFNKCSFGWIKNQSKEIQCTGGTGN